MGVIDLKNNDVPLAWNAHFLNNHRSSFCTFLRIKLKCQPFNKVRPDLVYNTANWPHPTLALPRPQALLSLTSFYKAHISFIFTMYR